MKRFVSFLIVTAVLFCMTSCSASKKKEASSETSSSAGSSILQEKETTGTEAPKQSDPTSENTDVTTITFAAYGDSDMSRIDKNHLKLLNEELLKDGHKYQLKIKQIGYDVYEEEVENALRNGEVDVAFLGLDDYNIHTFIDNGEIQILDDVLSSGNGKVLYEVFPEALWETAKCDGHFYSIPNSLIHDQGIYAVFNREYLADETIENWDGSIEGIYEMIKDVEWDDQAAPRFQYHLVGDDCALMIGCDYHDGLIFDHETMKIENPLESEKFIGFFRVLEQMRSEGFIARSVSYYANTSYSSQEENLKAGRFLVALLPDQPDEMFMSDRYSLKEIKKCLYSRNRGAIGIAKNTENVDAVIDFLALLYSEEKYGDILLFGKQDVDYKLVDGYVESLKDIDLRDRIFWPAASLNLFVNVHPIKGECFAENRKESLFSFYNDIDKSPFLGFNPDVTGRSDVVVDVNEFLDTLRGGSMDEKINEYKELLKEDGMDEYLSSVQSQWETYCNEA